MFSLQNELLAGWRRSLEEEER